MLEYQVEDKTYIIECFECFNEIHMFDVILSPRVTKPKTAIEIKGYKMLSHRSAKSNIDLKAYHKIYNILQCKYISIKTLQNKSLNMINLHIHPLWVMGIHGK